MNHIHYLLPVSHGVLALPRHYLGASPSIAPCNQCHTGSSLSRVPRQLTPANTTRQNRVPQRTSHNWSPVDHEHFEWLASPCMIARWHHWCHKRSHEPIFSSTVWLSSRSNFDVEPLPSDFTEKIYQIRDNVLECRFSFIGLKQPTAVPYVCWLIHMYTQTDMTA